ncbi:MAG TPA: hypothetical protein IAA29_17590 [Candidatus Paenibacillus intestinavium]|nr:hypothetical protein [Candidatus Paenibacillus intestinavium]
MNKRILIESIIFALLLMALIIGWQVLQGYLNTQTLSSEFPSELSNVLTVDTAFPNQSNTSVHIAYWSSPSILFGVNQPLGLDDLLELVGVLLIFATPYYFIRMYVHKRKTAINK